MNQAELISTLADGVGESKATVERVIRQLDLTMSQELSDGGEVTLPGIGKFSVRRKEARKGRNPATGAEISIPAKNVPHFSAAKALKDAVA